jgi:hypothetical protein
MPSQRVFTDLGRPFSRLELPGYWQSRRGFASSPQEFQASAEELQRWKLDPDERQVEGALSNPMRQLRDDFSGWVAALERSDNVVSRATTLSPAASAFAKAD